MTYSAKEYQEDIKKLKIKHFSQCTRHKNHFDIDSFYVGYTFGVVLIAIIVIMVTNIK